MSRQLDMLAATIHMSEQGDAETVVLLRAICGSVVAGCPVERLVQLARQIHGWGLDLERHGGEINPN